MKVQVPGEVKLVASATRSHFEKQVQGLVNEGFIPFSNMTGGDSGWALLMMKPKTVEVDPETGERLDGKN